MLQSNPALDHLAEAEKQALEEFLQDLRNRWPQSKCKVFGSKIKGTSDPESDLDVLVELPVPVKPEVRREIIFKVFELNLQHDTNLSVLIVSKEEWETGPLSILPIHSEIEKEGLAL